MTPDGYRLGVGGGWYDRALQHRGKHQTVLAWAREAEVVPAVPREPHDLPVDGYVTERGVHLVASGADDPLADTPSSETG